MSEIDDRLHELRRTLRGLSWRRRRRALDEARDHLLSAVADGLTPSEAVVRLGDEPAFAGFPARRRTHRWTLVAVPVAMLALVPSVGGTLQRLGAGTTPSQAATSPERAQELAKQHCVAAWNDESSGRWRAAAVTASTQQAYIGIAWSGRPSALGKQLDMRISGCIVKLISAPVASPYQPWTVIYASATGDSFHFDRIRHGHAKTAAPTVNARVGAGGRLTMSAGKLSAACPAGPIGSRIERVQATSAGIALSSGSTTSLAASRVTRFDVVVTNDGRVPIHGAVASIDVSGPARPNHAWWRSGPRVVRVLQPGASTTIRINAQLFGHGVRLLRVTSAAIACESRFADNSEILRVRAD